MPSSRWMSLWDICPPWGMYVYTWHEHVHVLYMYVHTCGEHVWVSAGLGFRPVDACLLWYCARTCTIFMVYSLVVQIPGMVWNLTTEVMKLIIYTVVNILDFYVISLFVSSSSSFSLSVQIHPCWSFLLCPSWGWALCAGQWSWGVVRLPPKHQALTVEDDAQHRRYVLISGFYEVHL